MDDILHILDVLRQRAESDLAGLTAKREYYLSDIYNVQSMIRSAQTPLPIVEDIPVLERWRENQIAKLVQIKSKLTHLDEDIGKAKLHYKTILAKNLAATDIAENLQTAKSLKEEDKQTDTLLEASLLKRMVKKKSL